jgi:hypothetical protein
VLLRANSNFLAFTMVGIKKGERSMKTVILALAVLFIGSTITPSAATAGPATDALTACMSDNTSGKDRKDMARWIFVGMSVHPEIKSLSNVTETDRDQLDVTMAALVTRLLTENCKVQAKLAMEKESGEAPLKAAFGVVGQLAMQELLANPEVNSTFTRFAKFLDNDKLQSAFSNK